MDRRTTYTIVAAAVVADIPSRSEAVRRLIGMGLEAAGKPPRKAGKAGEG